MPSPILIKRVRENTSDGSVQGVLYNEQNDNYLLVYRTYTRFTQGMTAGISGGRELFSMILEAQTFKPTGLAQQISNMGPILINGRVSNYAGKSAWSPHMVYNSKDNEFLVVWHARNTSYDGFEIWGQRINAETGAEVGENDFQITSVAHGLRRFGANYPQVVYNPDRNEYLDAFSYIEDTSSSYIGLQKLSAQGQRTGAMESIGSRGSKLKSSAIA